MQQLNATVAALYGVHVIGEYPWNIAAECWIHLWCSSHSTLTVALGALVFEMTIRHARSAQFQYERTLREASTLLPKWTVYTELVLAVVVVYRVVLARNGADYAALPVSDGDDELEIVVLSTKPSEPRLPTQHWSIWHLLKMSDKSSPHRLLLLKGWTIWSWMH